MNCREIGLEKPIKLDYLSNFLILSLLGLCCFSPSTFNNVQTQNLYHIIDSKQSALTINVFVVLFCIVKHVNRINQVNK